MAFSEPESRRTAAVRRQTHECLISGPYAVHQGWISLLGKKYIIPPACTLPIGCHAFSYILGIYYIVGSFPIRSSHCVWEQEVSHTNHRPVLRENNIHLLGSSKLYIQLELRTVTPIVIACRVKQTIDHSDLDMHSACHSWEQHRSSTSCCPTLIHSVNNMVYAVYAINNCQIFFTHAHARRQYYNIIWSP